MAILETWHASSQTVAFANAKHLIDLFNSSASAKTIKIFRIWVYNNQLSAVTGVLSALQVKRTSASSGGTTITSVAHSLGNTALNANTTVGTGRSVTAGAIFRQILWSTDEPVVTTLDMDSLLTLIPFCEIWSIGYGDINVQPLTCRASNNEGITLQQPGSNAAGTCDVEMEFTNE
jgi:hypothetical protein